MNLVINSNVTPSAATGVGRYIEGLTSALVEVDPSLRLTAFVNQNQPDLLSLPRCTREGLPFRPDLSFQHIPFQPYIMWRLTRLKADIYHLPNTSPFFFGTCPTVITIHDLQEFHIEKYGSARTAYRKVINALAARAAIAVITVSAHSKRTIVERLGIQEEKVHSIPLGHDERFRRVSGTEPLVPPPYVIAVGQLQPGKNYMRLLDAFSHCRKTDLRLAIVGNTGWDFESIFDRARQGDLDGKVIFLQNMSVDQLIQLYNHASLCVLPSLYEGFGLPVLEAMGCGVPVVAANNSAMPEVLGDAGLYFNPYDVEEMTWAIERVFGDTDLQDNMRLRGLARVKEFTWRRTAEATLRVYDSIV